MAIIHAIKKQTIQMTLEEVMKLILKEHGITSGVAEMEIDSNNNTVLVFHEEKIS